MTRNPVAYLTIAATLLVLVHFMQARPPNHSAPTSQPASNSPKTLQGDIGNIKPRETAGVPGTAGERDVKVLELPAIQIAKERKGWLDHVFEWGPWVFGLMLVGVGVGQAVIARGQAILMERQVELATVQTRLMDTQTRVLQQQAGFAQQTMTLQFRPRIRVRGGSVGEIKRAPSGELHGTAEFVFVNEGGTRASIVRSSFAFVVVDETYQSSDMFNGNLSLGAPTLNAGDGIVKEFDLGTKVASAIQSQRSSPSGSAGPTAKQVVFAGHIHFKDDVETTRTMVIYRKYSPLQQRFLPDEDPDVNEI